MRPQRGLVLVAAVALVVVACTTSRTGPDATTPASETTTTSLAISTTVPATTATTSTTMPPTDAELLAVGWVFETLEPPFPPGLDPPGSLHDAAHGMAASPLGTVLIGQLDSVNEVFRAPIVWYSPDNISWERVGEDVFATAEINDVIAGGPGFVAVGSECSVPDLGICDADPAVWTSVDGRAWDRVVHDPDVFPGCSGQGSHEVNRHLRGSLRGCAGGHYRATIYAVSATGHGLVAIGFDPTWTLLWHSEDGLTWDRIDRSAAPTYEKVGEYGWTIAMEDPGVWTAFGMVQPGLRCTERYEGDELFTDCLGLIWTSETGDQWTKEEADQEWLVEWSPVVTVESQSGVVVFGNRSLCTWCPLGELEPSSVVAAHSSDGIEWTEVIFPSADVGRLWSGSVITTPLGMVALAEEDPAVSGVYEPR